MAENVGPRPTEIEDQLRRMLASMRFKNAPKQSDFLILAVSRALQGKKTPGYIIARALFPKEFGKADSTHVRVTAGNLRDTLKEYYNGEGYRDPIVIALPVPSEDRTVRPAEGDAYTPSFIYNSLDELAIHCKRAEAILARGLLGPNIDALHRFHFLAESAPENFEVALGLAEAWCSLMDWASFYDQVELERFSQESLTLLNKLKPRAAKHWKFHAVSGRLFTQMRELDRAKAEFSTALRLSRPKTESYLPYFAFLAISGNSNLSVRLAEKHLLLRLDDPTAHVAYCGILLTLGYIDDADKLLSGALYMHANSGLVCRFAFLLRVFQRRADEAIKYWEDMMNLADAATLAATGGMARKFLEAWPDAERRIFYDRIADVDNRRSLMANDASRVEKSLTK